MQRPAADYDEVVSGEVVDVVIVAAPSVPCNVGRRHHGQIDTQTHANIRMG